MSLTIFVGLAVIGALTVVIGFVVLLRKAYKIFYADKKELAKDEAYLDELLREMRANVEAADSYNLKCQFIAAYNQEAQVIYEKHNLLETYIPYHGGG